MDTAAERDTRRSTVEQTYGEQVATREAQFVSDKRALETTFHSDLANIRQARRTALVGAGLNPDGSDPQGRPVGHAD